VEALARAGERQDPAGQQRFESEDGAFHQRVREGFLRLAKESPQRWAVLRAGQGIDDISEQVWERVAAVLTR